MWPSMPSKIRCLAQDFGSKPIRRVARGGRRGCSVSTSLTLLLAILESAPARLSQTLRSEVLRGPGVPPDGVSSKVLSEFAAASVESSRWFPANTSDSRPLPRVGRAACNQRYGKSREDGGRDAAHPPKLWHRFDASLGRSPRNVLRWRFGRRVDWLVPDDVSEVHVPTEVKSRHRCASRGGLSVAVPSCRAPEKSFKED